MDGPPLPPHFPRPHVATKLSCTKITSASLSCHLRHPQVMPAARKSAASPASRAAQLLAAQRKAKPIASSSSLSGSSSASASASEEDEDKPLPLPQLIQALTASKTLSTREALPIAACLVRAKLHTPKQLAMLSPMALQDAGVETEEVQRKVCAAFGRGKVSAYTCVYAC